MVTELSQLSSPEVEEIVSQLVQNVIERIFEDQNTSALMQGSIIRTTEGGDDIVAGLDSLMCLNTKMFEHFVYDEEADRCNDQEVVMDDGLDDVWKKMQKHRSVLSENEVEEKEDAEMELMILEDTYLTLLKGLLTDENINSRKTEEDMESQKNLNWEKDFEMLREDETFRQEVDWIIVRELLQEVSKTVENHERIEVENKRLLEEQGKSACLDTSPVFDDFEINRENEEFRQEVEWIIVRELLREVSETIENLERNEADNKRWLEEQDKRACLDTSLVFDDFEILREDGVFRQEVDWIIVREFLIEVSETVKNHERIEATNKTLLEEEVKRVCMEISLVFDDFDFKIQEKLKKETLALQHLEEHIDSTVDYIAELRRKESVYRTAFVLRSDNLIKAETEVDLLGDQVDSLVKLLQKTLWTFHQHPLLLCNHSDISEICKMIKEVLYEDHKPT